MRFRPDFRMPFLSTSQRANDPSERSERIRSERLTECCKNGNEKVQSSEKTISKPVLIILGPTGSGKTGVSIELAKKLNGEIISADSRAIYKGMDIGTAKPTREEMSGIPHHGLDLVKPGERFTVADWKAYASAKIQEIKAKGKLPIVAGGTGLYIDALIFDYHFKGPTGQKIGDFEQKSCSDRTEIKGDYCLIGIKWPSEKLRERLKQRIEQMFTEDLYKEVKKLVQLYGWDSQAMKSNIYEFAYKYTNDKLTLDEAKKKAFYEDWHLAKRQLTWFKRNPHIIWLPLEQIEDFVIKLYSE